MKLTLEDACPKPIEIDLETTAAILIDFQRDFMEEGGYGAALGNDVSILRRTIEPAQKVLSRLRELGIPIIHTQEGHEPDLSDCPRTKLERWPEGGRIGDIGPMGRILVRGEPGHEIIPELKPNESEVVIQKPGKNAFFKTNLAEVLESLKARTILVMGVTTDICGASTVAALNDYGYDPIVIRDCMASYSERRHEDQLNINTAQGGIWGWTCYSEELLNKLNA